MDGRDSDFAATEAGQSHLHGDSKTSSSVASPSNFSGTRPAIRLVFDEDIPPSSQHFQLDQYPNSTQLPLSHPSQELLAWVDGRSVTPDDSYRRSLATSNDDELDTTLPMAASSIPRPSLRSNGDGSTPRHPVVTSSRTTPRPAVRSASNPADARTQVGATSSSRVDTLKKRFDQKGQGFSSSRSIPTGMRQGISTTSTGSTHQFGASTGSQRPRAVPEDTVSSNVKSFASRIGKPRLPPNGNVMLSTPQLQQPRATSPQFPSATSTSNPPALLFGEILPDQHDTPTAGYGINDFVQPDQTEAIGLVDEQGRKRSLSHASVPGTWYSETTPQHDTSLDPNSAISDNASIRSFDDAGPVSSRTSSQTIQQRPDSRLTGTPLSSGLSASKLPVSSSRRTSNQSSPSNPSSPRSITPNTLKRHQPNGKRETIGGNSDRARTPTKPGAGPRPGPANLNNNTRLQAYAGAPPPKLSPPLRSSRPRQSVAMATTASSRMRAVEKGEVNGSRKADDPPTRRRKISAGPIDFEQRREHIRLAYSRSIRESQAEEARQRAVQRRQREMEAAARAKIAAEAAAANNMTLSSTTGSGGDLPKQTTARGLKSPSPIDPVKTTNTNAAPTPAAPLTVITDPPAEVPRPVLSKMTDSEASLAKSAIREMSSTQNYSPELTFPGAFPAMSPADSSPRRQSVASIESCTTEIDMEPQTDLATTEAEPPSDSMRPLLTELPSNAELSLPVRIRSEYHYPFQDDLESPIQVKSPNEDSEGFVQPSLTNNQSSVSTPEMPEDREQVGDLFVQLVEPTTENDTILLPSGGETIPTLPLAYPGRDGIASSDCHSSGEEDSEHLLEPASRHDDETDACSEVTHDQDDSMECDSVTQFEGSINIMHRPPSSCLSDAEDSYSVRGSSPPRNLAVPPLQTNRNSQQSQWTDYEVDSRAGSPTPDSATFGHVTIFSSPGFRDDEMATLDDSHGEAEGNLLRESSHRTSYFRQESQQEIFEPSPIPGTDDSDEYSIPRISRGSDGGRSYVPSPSHEPPPIPADRSDSTPGDSRASSTYYDYSRNGSTLLNSERASEDSPSPLGLIVTNDENAVKHIDLSSPQRMMSNGADPRPFATVGEAPGGKERQRIIQRLNVVKELVDTEAVFVRDMNVVEEIYKGTAEACPKLDDKTVKLLFRNTEEIISFHTSFLAQIKEAVSPIYVPKGGGKSREGSIFSETSQSSLQEVSDVEDRNTLLGPVFRENVDKMKSVHEGFLRNSDQAAKTLIQIQQDPTVKVWLNECNEVAKDLTAAWDLDSLLIKPMQRITKYPNLIITLLQHTPPDHPDREHLQSAREALETAIIEINQTKKNFELVGQIVGRKRKDSDVKAGFARAFGKRVDKLQTTAHRPIEDAAYSKLNEKFGDDYLRLQVVLRDVEFYTRQVTAYVHEFLQYLSSIELIMRLHPGSYPELESKWVQFNISVRDLEKVALEEHLNQVRKRVIEPFELVIKSYGNPAAIMKKRQKRRLDFERHEQLTRAGRSIDSKLKEQVEQYDALNATLVKELPKLSELTERVGMICLGNFVDIQTRWYGTWMEKMKIVLGGDGPSVPELKDIVSTFYRDFPYAQEQVSSIGILNPAYKGRASQSTTLSEQDAFLRAKPRPPHLDLRGRGHSLNADIAPSLPTPEFAKRPNEGLSVASPEIVEAPSPSQYYYRDYYSGIQSHHSHSGGFVTSPEMAGSSRSQLSQFGTAPTSTRPSTGRSYDSGGLPRPSTDSASQRPRDSSTTYSSHHQPPEGRRFSGLFQSALPLADGPEDARRSVRSSMDHGDHDGYHVLWLAASLFEFNINTTKHEAGYPYLIYQAGEIFDVIAEKGELWLAKNQDDPTEKVGWIWSKHFAKLADS